MPNGGNSTSSEALAKLLLNHVVGNWGVPLKIVSDTSVGRRRISNHVSIVLPFAADEWVGGTY